MGRADPRQTESMILISGNVSTWSDSPHFKDIIVVQDDIYPDKNMQRLCRNVHLRGMSSPLRGP